MVEQSDRSGLGRWSQGWLPRPWLPAPGLSMRDRARLYLTQASATWDVLRYAANPNPAHTALHAHSPYTGCDAWAAEAQRFVKTALLPLLHSIQMSLAEVLLTMPPKGKSVPYSSQCSLGCRIRPGFFKI